MDIDPNWILTYDWKNEHEWFTNTIPKVKSRKVFCIVDMNKLNCLIRDEPDAYGESVTLIDYEASSYGPRGYDIGGHYNHWLVDLTKEKFLSGVDYPSTELRREYCANYLKMSKQVSSEKYDPEIDSVECLLMESEFYSLVQLQSFTSFILMSAESKNSFNDRKVMQWFAAVAKLMLEKFFTLKAEFIEKYSEQLRD